MTNADEEEHLKLGEAASPRRLPLSTVVPLVAVTGLAGVAIGAWDLPDEEAPHVRPAQVEKSRAGDQADAVRPARLAARHEWTSPQWKVVGERRWITVNDSYPAVSVDAINTTPSTLPDMGPVVLAAFANAPGLFEAPCRVVDEDMSGKVSSAEIAAAQVNPQTTIPPGGRATFLCIPVQGSMPKQYNVLKGELRINRHRVFFVS
jgi:hypothetical protein